jgi:hypothetical protein
MAREYAKNWITTWTDEDFCTQPIFDKLLYQVLLGQPPTLLNYAGVQPLSMRRWRKAMRDADQMPAEENIMAALVRLERRRYVYTDDDTCEVLVRSFIRRDEVARQPNVLLSALRAAALVESPKLAAVLLAELTERIVLPEISGTSEKAEKLRQALKHTMNTAVNRLETLSEGLPKPFPEPFQEGLTEGLTRPAEIEPFPKPFREPFATGSVVVEVEVANSPNVVGYLGREREQTQAPPRFCPKHPDGTDKPCTGCADARAAHTTWTTAQTQATRNRDKTEATQRRQAAQAKAAAIHDCPLCDEDGYRIPECRTVCDHTDRTQTNQNGITKIRNALNSHTQKTPHA